MLTRLHLRYAIYTLIHILIYILMYRLFCIFDVQIIYMYFLLSANMHISIGMHRAYCLSAANFHHYPPPKTTIAYYREPPRLQTVLRIEWLYRRQFFLNASAGRSFERLQGLYQLYLRRAPHHHLQSVYQIQQESPLHVEGPSLFENLVLLGPVAAALVSLFLQVCRSSW